MSLLVGICAWAVAQNASRMTATRVTLAAFRRRRRHQPRSNTTTNATTNAIHSSPACPERGNGEREQALADPPICLYFS